jgi:hypothetical protein
MPKYRNGNVQLGLIHGGSTATFRSRSAKEVVHFHPPVSYLRSPNGIGLLSAQRGSTDGTETVVLSLLHILSTHCTRLMQSLHPVVKDAFQGGFFNTP